MRQKSARSGIVSTFNPAFRHLAARSPIAAKTSQGGATLSKQSRTVALHIGARMVPPDRLYRTNDGAAALEAAGSFKPGGSFACRPAVQKYLLPWCSESHARHERDTSMNDLPHLKVGRRSFFRLLAIGTAAVATNAPIPVQAKDSPDRRRAPISR
jgi:hypothetical protein